MVFKPFTHLARQSFVKSFTHGYAQSVVAASQSSYASSNTPFGPYSHYAASRFGKVGTSQLQNAFQNASSSSSRGVSRGGLSGSNNSQDGGLSGYFAAWQQQQQKGDGKEWQQYQFTKRIGWKDPAIAQEVTADGNSKVESFDQQAHPARATVERTYSESAVDDLKKVHNEVAVVIAAAEAHAAIADEGQHTQSRAAKLAKDDISVDTAFVSGVVAAAAERSSPASNLVPSPANSSTSETSLVSEGTNASSLDESQAYSEHIVKLQGSQKYAEIPAVFEAMLVAGIQPTANAYNALLEAAINLPTAKHQVVPKALDVYADMLRRSVHPNTTTYSILVELLASRALDVSAMKRSLEEKRLRYGGMEEAGRFMFRSNATESSILAEDDSLSVAVKLFRQSTYYRKDRAFSAKIYQSIITACAERGRIADMINIYAHMEVRQVVPSGATFAPMIQAFATSGDLSSAVECYNEYKALAMADDSGKIAVLDRKDNEVYAAVVKAYAICGKTQAGVDFFGKIIESFDEAAGDRVAKLLALEDAVISRGFVQERVDSGAFADALTWIEERQLSNTARNHIMAVTATAAADANDIKTATEAFAQVDSDELDIVGPTMSMLALSVRRGDVRSATHYWNILASTDIVATSFIEPTAMYAVALIGSGNAEEGLRELRHMFGRIRESTTNSKGMMDNAEQLDEGIEFIGRFLTEKAVILAPTASMHLMWTMIDNGGLVTPVAEHLLAQLGPEQIAQLNFRDLILTLQVQAGMIAKDSIMDIASTPRFGQLLEVALASGMHIDKRTSILIDQTLRKIGGGRPDLVQQWHNHLHPVAEPVYVPAGYAPRSHAPSVVSAHSAVHQDTYDPYGSTTDYKGSTIIADELERNNSRNGSHLNDALVKFRNMRRAGKHPRYITYAKLIAAAAKDDRMNLVHDILGMARQDMPLLPQYRVVRYGWVSILDSMVGACLTLGNRVLAAQYHQELLDMGAAPTANTFGLYITTLKESTKTFDEATEAVKIFHRAKSEGVEPSSFLYNALIGKLGKARRIDDCLFYFAEMRSLGIRPTSVTYGTIVNALCRVSDETFAEEMFEEMETMPNYKPRPAPYNSLMQFFLTTKRDRGKVLEYYERMRSKNIQPTMHTYKLLIDTYATLEPMDMAAAEGVLQTIRQSGLRPEAVHYSSLIHAKGCVMHDMEGARQIFDGVLADTSVRPQACLYQALFEAMVANHQVWDTEAVLNDMSAKRIEVTPYIANTLIHGWAMEKTISKSKAVYDVIGMSKREPSTYEAMTRAFLTVEDRESAKNVVQEMLSRGYPSAVSGKILELIGGGSTYAGEASA
ncbi:MAG: hypothetical protein M1812_000794 [Candelaria pacifica]|nr:MAG: hypothetical protein M1812_000794 [Candelaria pacifica]